MKKYAWIMILAVAVLGGAATGPAPIAPVNDAGTQAEARKLCVAEDLPAMALADRVVIETTRPKANVEVKEPSLITAIRNGLRVDDGPPSGGLTAYRLTFYRGEQKIRAMWVFDYGEWGVERPTGSSTCGRSDKLVPAIKDAWAKVQK